MFGPSVSATLKAAEEAIKAGRLEEAAAKLADQDVREQSRGRELLVELAEAYLARVRIHEQAGRYSDAMLDLNRAAHAGASPQIVNDLRTWLSGLAERDQAAEKDRRNRIEAARERIDAGSLQGGREMLASLDAADSEANRLQRDAQHRERSAERAIAEADRMMGLGQFGPACRSLEQARAMNPKAPRVAELEVQLVRQVLERVRMAVECGQLETAADLLMQLGEAGKGLPERSQWERTIDEARSAAGAVARADWSTARRCVLRLKAALSNAEWLATAAQQLDQLEEMTTAIHAGPLGRRIGPASAKDEETIAIPRPAAAAAVAQPVSERCRLIVDGAGSYLLLRQSRVSIGRASSGDAQPDIALMADLAREPVEVSRVEDDYFLFARHAVRVNGRETKQRLLEDGDRIELSPRVKLTFHLPSPRSATAVLELGGSLRLAGDVRRVILFDRHLTMGPGQGHHIVATSLQAVLAVVERAGGLYARTAGASGDETPLAQGQPAEVGGVRIALETA